MRPAPRRFIVGIVLALGACSAPGVTSVSIDGGDRTIVVGDVLTLAVTLAISGGAGSAVVWESSDESVAVVDGAGRVTGVAIGVTDVTATSVVDPGRSDTVTVTVDPPGVLMWTRQFGTSGEDIAFGVTTDVHGNVYLTGSTLGDLGASNAGGRDAFVRSYDRDGDLRWTRQFGTGGDDAARGVATDAHGNVYVTGYTFGALAGPNAGGADAFVRSYDGDGVHRWTRQFGSGSLDRAFGVATDAEGNVYAAGFTEGSLDGASTGGADAFVRSYDGDGVHRWTRQFGTLGDDEARGVATDASGNVYVGGLTLGTLERPNAGGADAFVRSYDGDGVLRWTRQFGTSGNDEALAVATDAHGNVYAAGRTVGALEGGGAGGADAYVRSYDGGGTLRWTRQFGTSSFDIALGVATDANGNVYAVGATEGALEGVAAGGGDAYVRSYDGGGTLRWTRQFGTSGFDIAFAVAIDASGDVYAAGYTLGALAGASAGEADGFVRKYGR